MPLSTLTALGRIADGSFATTGLWNRVYQQIDDNFASVQTTFNTSIFTTAYPLLSGETGVSRVTYPYGDIRRFGATPGVDATAAIQAAVDYYSGAGWSGAAWRNPARSGKVLIPEGVFPISSTITYNGGNAFSITIEGAAAPAGAGTGSVLQWLGAAGGVMFYAQGINRSVVRDIAFDGAQAGKHVLYCVQIDGKNTTQAGSPGSSQVLLDRVIARIGSTASSAALAFAHAGSNDQVDTMVVRDCHLSGTTTGATAGVAILSGGNVARYAIEGGTITSFNYSVLASDVGALNVKDTVLLLSSGADFLLTGAPLFAVLDNVWSEQGTASKFIDHTAGGGPGSITLLNCHYNAVAPATDVFISAGVTVSIVGGDFSNTRTGSSIPQIRIATPRHSGGVAGQFSGLYSTGAFYLNASNTTVLWPFADGNGNPLLAGLLPGFAGSYYDLYAMNTAFRSEGDNGGTRGTPVALMPQNGNAGNIAFAKLRSTSNDALTDVAADAAVGLKKGDLIKFKKETGGPFDSDVTALSKNAADVIVVGDTLGMATGRISLASGGVALRPSFGYSSESSLGFYRSAVSTIGISYGAFSIPSGSNTTPSLNFGSSESSLGLYRSGAATIAPSLGTFNLADNQVRLSMRTSASLDSTSLAVNEVAFSLNASGASLALRSGGTVWYFSSSASTKG